MSLYYKYNFISPKGVFATVQEELKTYFDTGSIDTVMFNQYLNRALDKLGKSSYSIVPVVLEIEDYSCRLPDNFFAVREAWLCTAVNARPYQDPNSFYSQASSETTIKVSPVVKTCTNSECNICDCDGSQCMPDIIQQAVYKTNSETLRSYKKQYLLKPGNISVKGNCSLDCLNFGSSSVDTFDIRDNKFVTNFRTGTVYLVMYATDYDNSGNQMIPDNHRVKEYLERFLVFKMFETLCNQVNDETFNQLEKKKDKAEKERDEAFIMADIEIRKQTAYQKQHAIKKVLNRNRMYELPNRNNNLFRRN